MGTTISPSAEAVARLQPLSRSQGLRKYLTVAEYENTLAHNTTIQVQVLRAPGNAGAVGQEDVGRQLRLHDYTPRESTSSRLGSEA